MSAPDSVVRPGVERDRALARLVAGLYCASMAFPLVASVGPRGQVPTWIGVLDVAAAAALLAAAFGATAVTRGRISPAVRDTSYRAYRALATVPLILLVVFLLVGDRLAWDVLLPGLGWRAWLLVYTLPAWLALWTRGTDGE